METLHHFVVIPVLPSLSSSHVQIDVVPGTIFTRRDRTSWTIQTSHTNLTEPDVELFMNVTHRVWFVS